MQACSCEINKMHTANSVVQDLASRPDSCSADNVMSCVYKIWNFVSVFTSGRFWSLSWARWIRSTLSDPVSQRRNLYNLNNWTWPGFDSRWGPWDFLFAKTRILGATQPSPIGTGTLPGGYSARGLAFTTHPFLAPRLERTRAISEHPSVRHDTLRRENYQLHLHLPSCYFPSGFPTLLLY
jgi:hypothetical protein